MGTKYLKFSILNWLNLIKCYFFIDPWQGGGGWGGEGWRGKRGDLLKEMLKSDNSLKREHGKLKE